MPGNPVKKRPQSDLVNQIPSDWSPELQKAYDKALKDYKAQMPAGDILDYVRTPFNVMSNSMAGLGAEMIGKGKQFEAKYGWIPKTQAEMDSVEAMMRVMGPVIDTMDYLKIPPIVGPNTPTIAAAMQGVDRAAARLTAQQAARAAANAGQAAKGAVKDLATSEPAYNFMNKVAAATGAAPKQIMMGGGLLGALAKTAERGLETAAKGAKAAVKAAPQDEALRLAQFRAALPPAQGGLGLPANNTPEQRAKAMAWNDDWLHGTSKDFKSFKPDQTYMTSDPAVASDYSLIKSRGAGNPVVMPLVSRGKMVGPKEYDQVEEEIKKTTGKGYVPSKDIHSELAKKGFAGYKEGDFQIVFDPSTLRSRFAAFDPFRRDAATAAAFGVAAPDLLAQEQEPEKELTIEEFLKRMKAK